MTTILPRAKINQIILLLAFYRGLILEAVELELEGSQKWNAVRSRLLMLLSPDRGLEKKILDLLLQSEDK